MKVITKITLLFIMITILFIHISYGFSIKELSGTDVTNSDALDWKDNICYYNSGIYTISSSSYSNRNKIYGWKC